MSHCQNCSGTNNLSCYGPAFRNVFEDNHVPKKGRYQNALVEDSANGKFYFYDVCGAWVQIAGSEGGVVISPVTSVNNKIGAVVLDADDVGAVAKNTLKFNIKDYGAVGDDIHDDTAAIFAAIAAADAAGGGTIYGPAGVYKMTDQAVLPAGVNVEGGGRSATFFHQTVINKRAFSLDQDSNNIYADLFMADFSVTGTGTGTASGIFLEASALWNVWIRDVSGVNFGGHGLHIRGAVVSRLEGVIGESNKLNGIYVDGMSSFSTSIFMASCFGLSNVAAGIRLDRVVYFELSGCANDFNDIGYHFYNCLSGLIHGGGETNNVQFKIDSDISFSTKALNLVGCYAYDTKQIGYLVTGYSQVVLMGCFDNQPHAGSTYSLQVDGNASVTEISNSWANPRNFVGGSKHTELADTIGDSHLNNVDVLAIRDINGRKVLVPQPVANAVNFFSMINAIAGNAPFFGPDGPDANIPLYLTSKGIADIRLARSSGEVIANFSSDNVPVNRPTFFASQAGDAVEIGASGSDANIDIDMIPKNDGMLRSKGKIVRTVAPNIATITSSATPAINTDLVEEFHIAALATNITSMTSGLSGAPYQGQTLFIYFQDNGTPRTIAWGSKFINSGVAGLLATTVANKVHLVGLRYDSAIAKWVCFASDDLGY